MAAKEVFKNKFKLEIRARIAEIKLAEATKELEMVNNYDQKEQIKLNQNLETKV